MKYLFLLALLPVAAYQSSLFAQAHQIEVNTQAYPSSIGASSPQVGAGSQNQAVSELPETADHVKPQKKERTLSIIKPDAVENRHIGDIISRFEDKGLRIVAIKMVRLNKDQAAQFYKVHRDRPFFSELVDFMASAPIVVMVLEGDQAITKNREIMGATDPRKAIEGTIRADLAKSMGQNAVHGSDSPEAAKEEILFFFPGDEIPTDN